jgi:hypothetical protein
MLLFVPVSLHIDSTRPERRIVPCLIGYIRRDVSFMRRNVNFTRTEVNFTRPDVTPTSIRVPYAHGIVRWLRIPSGPMCFCPCKVLTLLEDTHGSRLDEDTGGSAGDIH